MKVKICGFTKTDEVKLACDLGVDMVGAVMVPGSRRFLNIERARDVLNAATQGVSKVAVVSPESPEDLSRMENILRPDYFQIHLTFSLEEILMVKKKLGAGLIMVAPVSVQEGDRREVIENAIQVAAVADILLVDTKGHTGGGTGVTHDWSISRNIRAGVNKPMFLAGGLNHSNVVDAIRLIKPDGVDVASGVEFKHGGKDLELMRKFIEAVRSA